MNKNLSLVLIFTLLFLLFTSLLFAQEAELTSAPGGDPIETVRLNTIKYGTETEIANLIQTLKTEGIDSLDNEIIALVEDTRNPRILSGAFSFFSEREKGGLETRAIRAIEEQDEEKNETIIAAIDYLGYVKAADAVPALQKILEGGERRFMNPAFRSYGRVSGVNKSDEAAEYLIDFYQNKDPGDDNRREIITALGTVGSAKAVEFLAEIATDNEGRVPLRSAALESIAKIGDQSGLEPVLACISAADPNVRAAAVTALGPFSGTEVDQAILDAFRDSNFRSRLAAAQASRQRKLVAAVPYLKFRVEHDDTASVKEESLRALGAIANGEAVTILEGFFTDRKNSDRIRIISCEMIMEVQPERFIETFGKELDEAKQKNQTALYNGFLKVIGSTKGSNMEDITRRLLENNGVVEKSYGLDMAANNNLTSLSTEIKTIADGRHESLAAKARRTLEKLGISN